MTRRIQAFAVLDPRGKLLTTRNTRDDAEFSARILGGTDWESHGFTVEPATVLCGRRAPSKHPDMIE